MPFIIPGPAGTVQLTFDPVSEDAGNSPLNIITAGDPNPTFGLLDQSYPAPPLTMQLAGSVDTEGSLPASRKHENRTISLTVDTRDTDALSSLQAKVAKIAREGGTLQRLLPSGYTITFDLLSADTFEPTFDVTFDLASVSTVSMTFQAKPYGRGTEQTITMSAASETTLPVYVATATGIPGDIPGTARLVVTDLQAQAQRTVLWGIQSQFYNASAPLFYEAETCALGSGAATAAGPAGASGAGSNTVLHGALDTTAGVGYKPITSIGPSATAQSHVGTFRIFARVQAPIANTGLVSVRATWRRAVGAPSVTNTSVSLLDATLGGPGGPLEGVWVLCDLGMVTIPEARTGTQGWIGQIEAISTIAGDDIYMDWIMLVPVDEGAGIASTLTNPAVIASGSLEASKDGVQQSQSGGYWRDVDKYEGDYPRVPVAGLEGHTVRVIVKASRGDVNTGVGVPSASADAGTDDVGVALYVTPRWLVVPGA